jgi:mannosyl-oligosaccharide alpha-1,2-mannosidase
MPQLRLRRGRAAVFLAFLFLLILFFISSGPTWDASTDQRIAEIKAYGAAIRNKAAGAAGVAPARQQPAQEKTLFESALIEDLHNTVQKPPEGDDRSSLPYRKTEGVAAKEPVSEKIEPSATPLPVHTLSPSSSLDKPGKFAGNPSSSTRQPSPTYQGVIPENDDYAVVVDPNGELLPPQPTSIVSTRLHWISQAENYPVSTLIQLPTGTPKSIPRVQAEFKPETPEQKQERTNKLANIKQAFTRTWTAYRDYAWEHDELMPVVAGSSDLEQPHAYRDPFNGWAATLVDSLDTLWLMGMKAEFEEAVNATMFIDFTTSSRSDIPVFETTIRYLGGLMGAYDISGQKYDGLIKKAVELADILFGAFDTPNRMPVMYHNWKPQYAALPNRRAQTDTCLAEMGSLTLEFTRLAQITGEQKYYDAIARITNNLEDFQDKTSVAGLWPLSFDSSGCANEWTREAMEKELTPDPRKDQSSFGDDSDSQLTSMDHIAAKGPDARKDETSFADDSDGHTISGVEKRQVRDGEAPAGVIIEGSSGIDHSAGLAQNGGRPPLAAEPSCIPVDGLQTNRRGNTEELALGGRADSTYEYLPKEWLMLGGLNDQYKFMYQKMVVAAEQYLFFKPMINDSVAVTFSGTFNANANGTKTVTADGKAEGWLDTKTGHLNCFVGGMVMLGAKIFDRKQDMKLGEELSESCAWAYGITTSGVMPEEFVLFQCPEGGNCEWDEEAWHHELDPEWSRRPTMIKNWQIMEDKRLAQVAADEKLHEEEEAARLAEEAKLDGQAAETGTSTGEYGLKDTYNTPTSENPGRSRRQLVETIPEMARIAGATHRDRPGNRPGGRADPNSTAISPTKASTAQPPIPVHGGKMQKIKQYVPPIPPTHEEFIDYLMNSQHLYPGVLDMRDKRYILRPEAIESVFYMHRITGDPKWREYGWKMWQSVERMTRYKIAYSSVMDVTADVPYHTGGMESFWTAETLKYFYMLFEDEDVMSLDDYVLNTEAHPLLRPDARVRKV